MLGAHALVHLPTLVRSDLAVVVGVGHVEVTQRRGQSLLQGHTTILIRIGHLEHVARKATHAVLPASHMTIATAVTVAVMRSDALLTLSLSGIPFRAAHRPVAIGIEPF